MIADELPICLLGVCVSAPTQELEIGIGMPERIQGPVVAIGIQSQPVIPHQAPERTHNAVGLMPIAKPKSSYDTRDLSVVSNESWQMYRRV